MKPAQQLSDIALNAFSRGLNYFVQLDPHTQKKLEGLATKTIAIEFRPWQQKIYLSITELKGEVRLSLSPIGEVDTFLTGNISDFIALAAKRKTSSSALDSQINLQGDLELGQTINKLLMDFSIDWEEHLSHAIGDVPAHLVVRFIEQVTSKVNYSLASVQRNVGEYLQEEARHLVCQEELADFTQDIDELRNDVERAGVRLQLLKEYL